MVRRVGGLLVVVVVVEVVEGGGGATSASLIRKLAWLLSEYVLTSPTPDTKPVWLYFSHNLVVRIMQFRQKNIYVILLHEKYGLA